MSGKTPCHFVTMKNLSVKSNFIMFYLQGLISHQRSSALDKLKKKITKNISCIYNIFLYRLNKFVYCQEMALRVENDNNIIPSVASQLSFKYQI